MLSDTRTNAGLDNISRFRKMFTWEVPGERVICLMSSGNLSITQGVITQINRDISQTTTEAPQGGGQVANQVSGPEAMETILNAPSMFRVAQIIGEHMRAMQERHRETLEAQGAAADASFILTGQRAGGRHRLFLIYSAGNFIEATEDTPYFQIGEHKYGKPILDRVIETSTPIATALNAALVSMDSTIRSNLSVGMPLDLTIIRAGTCTFAVNRRIETDDETYAALSHQWSDAVRGAFQSLPPVPYLEG